MKTRIITALVMIVGLLFVIYLNSPILTFLVFLSILTLSFLESLKLYQIKKTWLVFIAVLQIFLLGYFLQDYSPLLFQYQSIRISIFTIVLIASFMALVGCKDYKLLAPFLYPTAPILMLFEVYKLFGFSTLMWLVVVIASCDSGAFFVGKLIGKHKFSISSPNKTIEGVIGGLIISLIVSLIYLSIFKVYRVDSSMNMIFSTLFVAVFGIFGDLFESLLKRSAGLKDSGGIFPGHGGMLDRVDGYLFGVVAMVLIW